jgi:hypothetical protein
MHDVIASYLVEDEISYQIHKNFLLTCRSKKAGRSFIKKRSVVLFVSNVSDFKAEQITESFF